MVGTNAHHDREGHPLDQHIPSSVHYRIRGIAPQADPGSAILEFISIQCGNGLTVQVEGQRPSPS